MAWVDKGYTLVVQIIDNGDNVGKLTYEMNAANNIDALVDALAIVGYLEAVCAAGTVSYNLQQKFVNDALVTPAGSGVQLEAKALLVMRDSADPTKKHIARVPAPETDVFLTTSGDGANIVDVEHQDVIDYSNMFQVSGECYISDGESIEDNGLLSGRRVTHRSRRG